MFTLTLKNDKLPSYRRVAILILLLHFFFFIYYLLRTGIGVAVVTGIVVTTVAIFLHFIATQKNKRLHIPASVGFLLLAAVWVMLSNYWFSSIMIILAFLDLISVKKSSVLFFPERIEIPSFPKKMIPWNELSNVILKDRILTIDFKNDHLLQSEIAEESFEIDEESFNLFCRQQLDP